jgi:hypothetical protein
MDDTTYLIPAEAARMFTPPITPARVRQMADDGTLPVIRTSNGMRLIRRADVIELVRKRQAARATAVAE